jgi:glycosyltransferase involved in cell wall biosynthesis
MDQETKDKFIIVMPAYNEAKNIAPVIKSIKKLGFNNILVVDDGSIDNTNKIAKSLETIVIKHPINLGLGAALRTGFAWAIKSGKFKYILTLDSDGQHKPQDVKRIAQKILDSPDLVIGIRSFFKPAVPIERSIINLLADLYTFLFTGKYIQDTQSGLRCFKNKALKSFQLSSIGYSISSEIIIEANRKNLSFDKIKIDAAYTKQSLKKGQSLKNSFKVIKSLLD